MMKRIDLFRLPRDDLLAVAFPDSDHWQGEERSLSTTFAGRNGIESRSPLIEAVAPGRAGRR